MKNQNQSMNLVLINRHELEDIFEKVLMKIIDVNKLERPSKVDSDQLLSTKEAMKHLNVSYHTLSILRSKGKLTTVKFGGRVLYRYADIKNVIENPH
jgi:excisionase family DNA binding protein